MINKVKLTLLKPTCPLLSVPVVGGIDVVGGGRDWTAGGALLATGAVVPGAAAPGTPPLLAAAAWLVSSVSWCVRAWIWDIMLLSRKAAGTAAGLVISFCFLSSCWSCCSCCSCCCCWWYKMTINVSVCIEPLQIGFKFWVGRKRANKYLFLGLTWNELMICRFQYAQKISDNIQGSQLGAFCPYPILYCYCEFKLCYLKNQKLFPIRVKEIIWAYSSVKKRLLLSSKKKLFEPTVRWKKGDRVFALFKSIFLRNRSLSNTWWFYGKKCKIGKGNLYSKSI